MRFLTILAIFGAFLIPSSHASAQTGYFEDPPQVARPNGYVLDAGRGWQRRPSFYGGYNTGPHAGHYGFYRRAYPPWRNGSPDFSAPRYGGFGPGIRETRRFGGPDFYGW